MLMLDFTGVVNPVTLNLPPGRSRSSSVTDYTPMSQGEMMCAALSGSVQPGSVEKEQLGAEGPPTSVAVACGCYR